MSDVILLGIESSCDETAAAVVKNGRHVLSNVIHSQILLHRQYGGVVPEIASRKHVEHIDAVTEEALTEARLALQDIDGVAVTYGPGLVGALLTGLSFAKALAYAAGKPMIGVHHIEGHICANYIDNDDFKPPFICLVVSGGHTHLVHVSDYGQYEILGKTRDDAAGEAYDKVARSIGLPYPGGVQIDQLSKKGNPYAIDFPRALAGDGTLDFSFSGLKSAVLNYINKANMQKQPLNNADIAASFQQAVIDILVQKSMEACRSTGARQFAIAGGVASNTALRQQMAEACMERHIHFHVPPAVYCTDNAAMIASCGYFEWQKGIRHKLSLNAYPSLKIGSRAQP